MTTATHRRALLNAFLALPLIGTGSGVASALEGGKSEASVGAGLAGAMFSNRRSAAILGQAYLLQRPEESDVDRLEALVLSPANLAALSDAGLETDDIAAAPPGTLKKAFQSLRRRDFDEGQVLQIDDCMLSVTELRLCALAALT